MQKISVILVTVIMFCCLFFGWMTFDWGLRIKNYEISLKNNQIPSEINSVLTNLNENPWVMRLVFSSPNIKPFSDKWWNFKKIKSVLEEKLNKKPLIRKVNEAQLFSLKVGVIQIKYLFTFITFFLIFTFLFFWFLFPSFSGDFTYSQEDDDFDVLGEYTEILCKFQDGRTFTVSCPLKDDGMIKCPVCEGDFKSNKKHTMSKHLKQHYKYNEGVSLFS